MEYSWRGLSAWYWGGFWGGKGGRRGTVDVVWMEAGVRPALPNSAANAIERQPAWAAAMSSSGFVPAPLSKRVEKEYCVSLSTPLSVEIVPWPSFRPPRQVADAVRFM